MRAHASAAGDVEIEDEGAFIDVDTPEEYQRLVGGARLVIRRQFQQTLCATEEVGRSGR